MNQKHARLLARKNVTDMLQLQRQVYALVFQAYTDEDVRAAEEHLDALNAEEGVAPPDLPDDRGSPCAKVCAALRRRRPLRTLHGRTHGTAKGEDPMVPDAVRCPMWARAARWP